MSDATDRTTSQKSRQELLDELYYLRDVAGKREQEILSLRATLAAKEKQIADTRAELDRVFASRSWRLTSPLRAFARLLGGAKRPSNSTELPVPTEGLVGKNPSTVAAVAERRGVEVGPVQGGRANTPRLFVDVTELALREGRTGVQRVVREILRALFTMPPAGFSVEPVYAGPGQPYQFARAFTERFTGNMTSASDALVEVRAGDVFLGLDHSMQAVIDRAEALEQMRAQGVRIWFVCNDTLPLSRPEWFPPEVHQIFKQWFETIVRLGDGIACISQATENEVRRWMHALDIQREGSLALGQFHLGADIEPGTSQTAVAPQEQADIDRLHGMQAFLMVGTLEPRKGHAQALEAFNLLWAQGEDVALVIVGLPGWMTEVVQRRIRHHDEFGKRLFWYQGTSDAMLGKLYTACTALLAPSEGEGFGLPLVEAARHGLPILCRDLPVFRELAGEYATYFSGLDASSLADAIRNWLGAYRAGVLPSPTEITCVSWMRSALELLGIVLGDQWLANRAKAETSAHS